MESVYREDLFAGKVVAITGGSSGIGLGISQAFAAHGAEVVVMSRSEERLQAACALIPGSRYIALDVRDKDALQSAAKAVVPDVLINAAAGNFPVPFNAMSDNAWESVLEIVLGGTVNATRAFAGGLRKSKGSVINIVAGYAWTGAPGVSHSGAAKAAVLNLTKSLAVEWAPDVRLNAVSPGPIGGTEGIKRLSDDLGLQNQLLQSVPLGRLGEPADVANACLFLASDAAKYVTGSCLVVDGGQDALGPFGPILLGMGL